MDGAYDQLVLVAEPRFLGMLLGALPKQTASRVQSTVPKDLHHVDTRELEGFLARA